MLSVIILPGTAPADLAELLAQLVPAAVDGLVRDVLLAGSAEGVALELCEEAGVVIAADRSAAERAAKSDWLLVLPEGFKLPQGWASLVLSRIGSGGGPIREARGGLLGLGRRAAQVARR